MTTSNLDSIKDNNNNEKNNNINSNNSKKEDDEQTPSQGRKAHSSWSHFTDLEAPWREKSAPCKHCNAVISYNKKNENIQRHLRHCIPFINSIRA